MRTFDKISTLPASLEKTFEWHKNPGALQRLLPPYQPTEILEASGGIQNGGRIKTSFKIGPIPVTWISEHRDYRENEQFFDEQTSGPFKKFQHWHRFRSSGADECEMTDHIEYELPCGLLGSIFGSGLAERNLKRMFDYRHRQLKRDFTAHRKYSSTPQRILISGATGFVGSHLVPFLTTGGHEVWQLVRRQPLSGASQEIFWDPMRPLEPETLSGFDAVIHLSGENVIGFWNNEKKKKILESRTRPTKHLSDALAQASKKPSVFISASAVGFYGNRGDEILSESSSKGSGFLSDVCYQKENASASARKGGIRCIDLRIGIVLDPRAGALAEMIAPARFGLGGNLGDGTQWTSWISMDDVLQSILHVIHRSEIEGPVNLCSPHPVRNSELARAIATALHRPKGPHAPRFILRKLFGEMADEILLSSARVEPQKLTQSSFEFHDTNLNTFLRHVLGLL